MKARAVILPDGQISFFVDEGSFEEAREKLAALVRDLAAAGLNFSEIGTVEQHRHDDQHQHNHVHAEE